jgi:GNAT superfamily N-acetyltransferase
VVAAPFTIRPLDPRELAEFITTPHQASPDDAAYKRWLKANADAFTCGNDDLDRYLRTQITQDQRRNVAKAFVAVETATKTLAGYYTLSTALVRLEDLSPDTFKRLPRYPYLPAVLMGRLAIDRRYQGQGLGGALLIDACRRAKRVAAEAALLGLIIDAVDDAARSFYEAHHFQRSPVNPYRLILPIQTIQQLDI